MGHYSAHAGLLRAELGRALPRDLLKQVHQKSAARHLLIAVRQFTLLGLATWGLIRFSHPVIWIPLALVQGFTVFNFTVLLHEVVHLAVFATRRPHAERALALLYAVPSGISAAQFTRWHLDHHAELGSSIDDPMRHDLSPQITYPVDLQRRIAAERKVSIAAHLTALALIWWFFGGGAALRAYVLPVFFVFPIAFTLNRLGQHYDIDPADPARWSTLVRANWFWNFWFLNSNLHLEHHYFPGVPFYNLPRVQRALMPFYERHRIPWRSYTSLVRGWLFHNKAPHSNWDLA
jgi:fatty acid desaturase